MRNKNKKVERTTEEEAKEAKEAKDLICLDAFVKGEVEKAVKEATEKTERKLFNIQEKYFIESSAPRLENLGLTKTLNEDREEVWEIENIITVTPMFHDHRLQGVFLLSGVKWAEYGQVSYFNKYKIEQVELIVSALLQREGK